MISKELLDDLSIEVGSKEYQELFDKVAVTAYTLKEKCEKLEKENYLLQKSLYEILDNNLFMKQVKEQVEFIKKIKKLLIENYQVIENHPIEDIIKDIIEECEEYNINTNPVE